MAQIVNGFTLDRPIEAGQLLRFNGSNWEAVNDTALAGAGASTFLATVDFGPAPLPEQSFTVAAPNVTPQTLVTAQVCSTPPGKDADEVDMDSYLINVKPGNGEITIYLRGLEGHLHDKFNVLYNVT